MTRSALRPIVIQRFHPEHALAEQLHEALACTRRRKEAMIRFRQWGAVPRDSGKRDGRTEGDRIAADCKRTGALWRRHWMPVTGNVYRKKTHSNLADMN